MKLDTFLGQARIMPMIKAEVNAANKEGRAAKHMMLYGPPGVGKTTLAQLIAADLKAEIIEILCSKEWTVAKVNNTLLRMSIDGYDKNGRNLGKGKRFVIFLDEVHSLASYEAWYTVLLERSVKHNGNVSWLPELTIIAATTELGDVPAPFRDRFLPYHFRLDNYTEEELTAIILKARPKIGQKTAQNIAHRSRSTARYALAYAEGVYAAGSLKGYFDAIEVDEEGFNREDRLIIDALDRSANPMSLDTLAATTGIPKKDILTIYEPFLKSKGMVQITPKGRTGTIGGRGPLAK